MKKVLTIALAVVLVLGITALAYGKGPAEKATGGVGTDARNAWRASFNAHEGPRGDGTDGKGQLEFSSSEAGRNLHCVVKYVNVDPANSVAWFAAQVTYDSAGTIVGKWYFVKVLDGGSPGRGNDCIWWQWATSEGDAKAKVMAGSIPDNMYNVTNGNLVVH